MGVRGTVPSSSVRETADGQRLTRPAGTEGWPASG